MILPLYVKSSYITLLVFRYHNYTNAYYRDKQVDELMDTYITKSKASVVLLGGDFNAGPEYDEGTRNHLRIFVCLLYTLDTNNHYCYTVLIM